MKIFIDLGAYTGDTIETALEKYKDFDRFYAFEPFKENFKELEKKYGNNDKVVLINAAADVRPGEAKLYLDRYWGTLGGSLLNKNTSFQDKFEVVKTVDFSNFIKTNFPEWHSGKKRNDRIILKLNIEGKEYEILDKMIKEKIIDYIDELFCDWHYTKIGLDAKIHWDLIKKLRIRGFNLISHNYLDGFKSSKDIGMFERRLRKFYYFRLPVIFNLINKLRQFCSRYVKNRFTIPPYRLFIKSCQYLRKLFYI